MLVKLGVRYASITPQSYSPDIEFIGIDPPFAGVYREARKNTQIGSLSVQAEERLFLSTAKASVDVSSVV